MGGLPRQRAPIRSPRPTREPQSPEWWYDCYDFHPIERNDHEWLPEIKGYPGPPPRKRRRENVKPGELVLTYMTFIDDEAHWLIDDWVWLLVRGKHGDFYEGVILEEVYVVKHLGILPIGKVLFFKQQHVRAIALLEGGVDTIYELFGDDFFQDSWKDKTA